MAEQISVAALLRLQDAIAAAQTALERNANLRITWLTFAQSTGLL